MISRFAVDGKTRNPQPEGSPMISLGAIRKAAEVIRGKVIRTPLVYSPTFSHLSGAEVYLKLENLQQTGSFKLRGASYKIHNLRSEIGSEGVVAASAGNHAQGVALAAKRAGFKATIVMPESASISKQEATRSYGGEVVLEGQNIGECIQKAKLLAQQGRILVHPFDDPDIVAGQGTIGLEILQDLADPDFIFVPIGGGGLISGIASAVKALRPQTRVIGVQAAACPSAYQALREGGVARVEADPSIADGIAVRQIGDLPFAVIRETVEEVVLVDEDQIAAAMLMLIERKKVLSEGAGSVPLAALLGRSVEIPKGSTVILVISGGNVDSPLLERVIRQGLFRNGRIMRFSVCLDDAPWALAGLLAITARLKANVLHIYHQRSGRNLPVTLSHVEVELETRGAAHIEEIIHELQQGGYEIDCGR
jgi:threonine dehydratase